MEKYKLIGEKKIEISVGSSEHESDDVCEVKITQQGKPKNYISYAMNLFVSIWTCICICILACMCMY